MRQRLHDFAPLAESCESTQPGELIVADQVILSWDDVYLNVARRVPAHYIFIVVDCCRVAERPSGEHTGFSVGKLRPASGIAGEFRRN